MGDCYYGICHDCKRYIDLDKFYAWRTYKGADHSTIDNTKLEDYKNDSWIYRALRLHIFLSSHNGHRVGVYPEHDIDEDELKESKEQYPWPEGLRDLIERIDLTPSVGRLIINTRLGEIFIDDRSDDINCFRFIDGKRVDTKILTKKGLNVKESK